MHLLAVSFLKRILTDFPKYHTLDWCATWGYSLLKNALIWTCRSDVSVFIFAELFNIGNNSFLNAFKQSSWKMGFVNWINYFWNSIKHITSVQNCPRYNNMSCPNIVYCRLALSYLYIFIVVFHRILCRVLTEAIFVF